MAPNAELPKPPPNRKLNQHGVNGAYYAGDWVDMEDLGSTFHPSSSSTSTSTSGESFQKKCQGCPVYDDCRSRSKMKCSKDKDNKSGDKAGVEYDIVLVGAGCIGSAIARELSRYKLSVLLVEAADDVSQGATKGNSGIVHAGYDDKPNTNRSKYCWTGNQMFSKLDSELRFGYQKNGSLVLAMNDDETKILQELMKRGDTNGVKNLRILNKTELFEMEPAVNPDAVAALHSPDAGNVIPYEYAIALAENAVDNGVELRIRREVVAIEKEDDLFTVKLSHWEPSEYVESQKKVKAKDSGSSSSPLNLIVHALVLISTSCVVAMGGYMTLDKSNVDESSRQQSLLATIAVAVVGLISLTGFVTNIKRKFFDQSPGMALSKLPFDAIVSKVSLPLGSGGKKASVEDMFTGGSGSSKGVKGKVFDEEIVKAKYVINCAGGASDKVANMIGDFSFKIKPRLGDYLLLNRNQGHLTSNTIFPCPDPILGKGVLVQTTLWGNLILGPTARDTYKPDAMNMSDESVQEYILSKCKKLIPYFDPKETFHAFCGARAKSDRGDWIIERSDADKNFVNVAGIDSPGLAGSPAIALEVVRLLKESDLQMDLDPTFNPDRAPIISPKKGMRGLKMGPVGKNDSNGSILPNEEERMRTNVVCKCEKVTELEVVRAIRRSLPIDSTQAIRKRTRAGMGHCQGDIDNYNCECRVKAIIARENRIPSEEVGGRPWPATSTLSKRWIDDSEKDGLLEKMMK